MHLSMFVTYQFHRRNHKMKILAIFLIFTTGFTVGVIMMYFNYNTLIRAAIEDMMTEIRIINNQISKLLLNSMKTTSGFVIELWLKRLTNSILNNIFH